MATDKYRNIYEAGGQIAEVKIIDTATPFLQKVANECPIFLKRAVRHTGWWLQSAIKYEIRRGAPGGQSYSPFAKIKNIRTETEVITLNRLSKKTGRLKEIRRRIGVSRLVRESTHRPLGRLANAVGYKFYSDSIRSIVGWLSLSAQYLGSKMERGFTIHTTPKMKRLFAASGFGLGKSKIDVPARPTFGPIYKQKAEQIGRHLENRVWKYIEEAGMESTFIEFERG